MIPTWNFFRTAHQHLLGWSAIVSMYCMWPEKGHLISFSPVFASGALFLLCFLIGCFLCTGNSSAQYSPVDVFASVLHQGNHQCFPFGLLSILLQLLDRVFDIMRAKNPDMVAGEKRKFVLKPPQVVRIGAKKTSFVNFTEICKL